MKNEIRIISCRIMDPENKERALNAGIRIEDYGFLSFDYSEVSGFSDTLFSEKIPLVFTSRHAVLSMEKILQYQQKFSRDFSAFCIQGITRETAEKKGFRILGEAPDAEGLSLEILKTSFEKVLYACGNLRRDTLINRLSMHGVNTEEVLVYHKILHHFQIEPPYQGISFFSPSQVDAFRKTNVLDVNIPAFCIGKTTGAYLHELGHKNTLIATESRENVLIQQIIHYFN